MLEPKLLAFSLLLGGISVYLVVKSRKPSKEALHEAEEATKRAERRKLLVEQAAEIEKGYALLDEKFVEDLAELERSAQEYKEEMLEAEADGGWKLGAKAGQDKNFKQFSDSASDSPEPSSQDPREGSSIYAGLRYKLIGTSGDGTQALEFALSSIPYVDSAENDKEVRRKPLVHAVAETAKIIIELSNLAVKLRVCSPANDSAFGEDKPEGEEVRRVSDLVKDTGYAGLVYRQLMPKKLLAGTAALLGYDLASSREEHDSTFFFNQLVAVLQPRTILVNMQPPSSILGEKASLPIDPERCLIPAKQMPLALAGAKVFRNRKHALDTLEVGPFIPISQHCGSTYHFAFAEWRIKTLVIWYDGIVGAAPGQPPGDTSGSRLLPTILFDPTYGFVRMMAGTQGDDLAQRDTGTRVVLLVQNEAHIDSFRQEVEWLANPMVSYPQVEDTDGFSNPTHRLELFQEKLFYSVRGETEYRVKPIWSAEPLQVSDRAPESNDIHGEGGPHVS